MKFNTIDLRKAASTLSGILRGVSADGRINDREISYLSVWLDSHSHVLRMPSFSDIGLTIHEAIRSGGLDEEDKENILWLCEKYLADNLGYDEVSDGLRELHGILGGITADGKIEAEEIRSLQSWINDNAYLKGSWPYDEVETLANHVMQDGVIDNREHEMLMNFFSEFVVLADDKTITHPLLTKGITQKLESLVQTNPDLEFKGQVYAFTGKSSRASRNEIAGIIESLGGAFSSGVSKKVGFLVIGSEGSECWQYACYGRKIEQAVKLRKAGHRIMLIHEFDFWDSV